MEPICEYEISDETMHVFKYLISLKELKNVQLNVLEPYESAKINPKYENLLQYNTRKMKEHAKKLQSIKKKIKNIEFKIKIYSINTSDNDFDLEISENIN